MRWKVRECLAETTGGEVVTARSAAEEGETFGAWSGMLGEAVGKAAGKSMTSTWKPTLCLLPPVSELMDERAVGEQRVDCEPVGSVDEARGRRTEQRDELVPVEKNVEALKVRIQDVSQRCAR